MATNPWDDPGLSGGDYIRFNAAGDSVTGTVTGVTIRRYDNGDACPQLVLDTTDGTKTVTGSAWDLKRQLMEQRPMPGDRVRITLREVEPLADDRVRKHFTVQVKRAEAEAAPEAPTPTPDSDLEPF